MHEIWTILTTDRTYTRLQNYTMVVGELAWDTNVQVVVVVLLLLLLSFLFLSPQCTSLIDLRQVVFFPKYTKNVICIFHK